MINWKGWRDTVECLASLLVLQDAPLHIVVCDNGSPDDSVAHLRAWLSARPDLRAAPDVPDWWWGSDDHRIRVSVSLLALPANLGYAGGINAGIAWARENLAPPAFFWLLNNDVQVQPRALRALIARRPPRLDKTRPLGVR